MIQNFRGSVKGGDVILPIRRLGEGERHILSRRPDNRVYIRLLFVYAFWPRRRILYFCGEKGGRNLLWSGQW